MPRVDPQGGPDFLTFSAALPASRADNAGSRYVFWVVDAVARGRTTFVVAPDGAAAQRGLASGRVPEHLLLKPAPRILPGPFGRLARRVTSLALPIQMPWAQYRAILWNPRVRRAVRQASVIDLQWEEHGALMPLLRRINPNARVVCTLHDVLSQRYGRAERSSTSTGQRLRWAWARSRARSLERRIAERADAIVVFSEKDARLLPPGSAEVHVVRPPIEAGLGRVERSGAAQDTVLFVGFLARWENEEGLLWFLREVWPQVRAAVPRARFKVAGLGTSPAVRTAAELAGVELLGFVPELEELYEDASLVVVPLRLGAGVKFKVVEALIAGIPVVTTSVGAEGIGDATWFEGVHDDSVQFAMAVVNALHNVDQAAARAHEVRQHAREQFGLEQFREALTHVYARDSESG